MEGISLDFKLKAHYKMEAHRVDNDNNIISTRVVADWFDNLITDIGLEGIGAHTTGYNVGWCVVGSGNTTPATSDTHLSSFVAVSDTTDSAGNWVITSQIATLPYYVVMTNKQRFLAGTATGNLSEVGMTTQASSRATGATDKLFSRALILDGVGNPTTITILPDEILDVTYQIYLYLPNGGSDIVGTFNQTIDGVVTPFNYTLRAANVPDGWRGVIIYGSSLTAIYTSGSYTFNIPLTPINTYPSTLVGKPDSSTFIPYVANSKQYDTNIGWGVSTFDGVFSGVLLTWNNSWQYQMSFTPSITKDSTKTYSLTVRTSWGRY